MKVLILDSSIQEDHPVVQTLSSRGVAVLLTEIPAEAWKVLQLHGESVDLAVVHRENPTDENLGLEFIQQFKKDKDHQDLPFLITTDKWSDDECAKHQETTLGANAYLRSPYEPSQLVEMIEAVLGESLGESKNQEIETSKPQSVSQQPPSVEDLSKAVVKDLEPAQGFVLEDSSGLYIQSEINDNQNTGISLKIPEDYLEIETSGLPTAVEETSSPKDEIEISASSIEPIDVAPELPKESQKEDEIEKSEIEARMPPPPVMAIAPSSAPAPDLLQSSNEDSDIEAQEEMPYLFGDKDRGFTSFSQPLGDAVIPGGAAEAPDIETLKKYLLLREQDVGALSSQLKTAKEQLSDLELQLSESKSQTIEFQHIVNEQNKKISSFDKTQEAKEQRHQEELDEIKFKVKTKNDKIKVIESKLRDALEDIENLKERVRVDIRKIRVREKELENKLEIVKKDSEVLIAARENKIIELKRKLDLVEFNMDVLQDKYEYEKQVNAQYQEKLARAAQAMKVAGGMLEEEEEGSEEKKRAESSQQRVS
mgnify:CR=1 FL=1